MGRWSSEGNTFMSWGYVECLANQFRSDFEAFEVQLEDISFLWFLQVNHVPELLHVDEWYFSSVNECLVDCVVLEDFQTKDWLIMISLSNKIVLEELTTSKDKDTVKRTFALYALRSIVCPPEIPEPKRTKMINKKHDELLKTRNKASIFKLPRTRSKPAAETEGLNKYDLLRTTTTTQEEEVEEESQHNVRV
ncbi:hypothetical protein Tco_1258474 [Tanacetum coccineum]